MLVSRRHFFFGSLALPALAAKKPAVERPSIVVMMADNLPAWMLASYGNQEIKSPNIQRLNDTGTRFLNHYVAAPAPALNRVCLLTGRTPMQIGDASAPAGADVTLDKLLAGAGYSAHAASDLTDAVKFIDQQAPAKPFVLTLNVGNLKPPYDNIPKKYLDLYAREKFETYSADPVDSSAREGKEMLLDRVGNLRKVAAGITALDDEVGAVLGKLAEKQLLDGTLVIFVSTCGALYGRHGLWGSGLASNPPNMYDEVVKSALIWSWPHRIPPQGVVVEMTSAYDLVPSICDLLTLAVPNRSLCGRSYLPVAQRKPLPKKQPWRKAICAHLQNTDMAREEDYKVVLRDGGKGPGELYDRTKDPVEKVNLYDVPEYLDVKTRLTAEITRWKQNYSA